MLDDGSVERAKRFESYLVAILDQFFDFHLLLVGLHHLHETHEHWALEDQLGDGVLLVFFIKVADVHNQRSAIPYIFQSGVKLNFRSFFNEAQYQVEHWNQRLKPLVGVLLVICMQNACE